MAAVRRLRLRETIRKEHTAKDERSEDSRRQHKFRREARQRRAAATASAGAAFRFSRLTASSRTLGHAVTTPRVALFLRGRPRSPERSIVGPKSHTPRKTFFRR